MDSLLAYVIGVLFSCAIYMMLRRSIVKLVIGFMILGNAANLMIFTVPGMRRNAPPLIPTDATVPLIPVADPLPQALILTAIVISFGVLAFAVVLIHRAFEVVKTDDLDQMKEADS
jgi:multicomponent Na+:H+ antiporter subunit C